MRVEVACAFLYLLYVASGLEISRADTQRSKKHNVDMIAALNTMGIH